MKNWGLTCIVLQTLSVIVCCKSLRLKDNQVGESQWNRFHSKHQRTDLAVHAHSEEGAATRYGTHLEHSVSEKSNFGRTPEKDMKWLVESLNGKLAERISISHNEKINRNYAGTLKLDPVNMQKHLQQWKLQNTFREKRQNHNSHALRNKERDDIEGKDSNIDRRDFLSATGLYRLKHSQDNGKNKNSRKRRRARLEQNSMEKSLLEEDELEEQLENLKTMSAGAPMSGRQYMSKHELLQLRDKFKEFMLSGSSENSHNIKRLKQEDKDEDDLHIKSRYGSFQKYKDLPGDKLHADMKAMDLLLGKKSGDMQFPWVDPEEDVTGSLL